MPKNIVEVYKELNHQFIILISGLSGCGKTVLGNNISRDFKIDLIDTKKFYKKDFDEKIQLPNGMTVTNYDTDNAMDWVQVNANVNKMKAEGVVVIGHAFPTDKIEFKPDYHIHLKISKQKLKDKRLAYIERHKELNFNAEAEALRVNAVTYPYYLDVLKRMKMDKFIDATELSDDNIYDEVFDAIIKFVESRVYHHDTKKKNTTTETSSTSESDIIPYEQDYVVSYDT